MKDRVMIVGAIVAVHLIIITLFIFSGDDGVDIDSPDTLQEEIVDNPDAGPVEDPEIVSEDEGGSFLENLEKEVTSGVNEGEVYIVQPGDSLMAISKAKYGTSKYYLRIYEHNKDTMKSPSAVRVGQKLILPELQ